jgi:hypothetical protein
MLPFVQSVAYRSTKRRNEDNRSFSFLAPLVNHSILLVFGLKVDVRFSLHDYSLEGCD